MLLVFFHDLRAVRFFVERLGAGERGSGQIEFAVLAGDVDPSVGEWILGFDVDDRDHLALPFGDRLPEFLKEQADRRRSAGVRPGLPASVLSCANVINSPAVPRLPFT